MPPRLKPSLRLATRDGDAAPGWRPKGSRRPHRNATVRQVRRLIETTPYTYEEISALTGVGRASICRWTRDGGWQRHLFAPRATDTVPRERAGARLKLRTLAARLAAQAELCVRALEEAPNVDVEQLGEALALYQMAKLAARPRKPRSRPFDPDAPRGLRVCAELRAEGVAFVYAPEEAVKDYIKSTTYAEPALRPKNRTKRERREDWMREKEER